MFRPVPACKNECGTAHEYSTRRRLGVGLESLLNTYVQQENIPEYLSQSRHREDML
jgi:hypothetical protein